MRRLLSVLPIFLLPVIFMAPSISLDWGKNRGKIIVRLESQDEHVTQCIESGLEVRYRFEYQMCRKRGSWFDACTDQQLLNRSVQYDPVSESYRIKTDSLADSEPAVSIMETDSDLAFSKISQFLLPYDGNGIKESSPHYISVRFRGYCQREEQSLLTQIPYYLTLGIFRFTGFDTGWVDFSLQ